MRRSVLILIASLATVAFWFCSTSARAHTANPAGGSSSPAIQRPMVHLRTGPLLWRVGAVKLLAPGVGWAQGGNRFLWTKNGGNDWKDITPLLAHDEILHSVFFLDRSKG